MTEALKPCPFCGGPVELAREKVAGAIQCTGPSSCLHTGLLIGFDLANEAKAIAAWNRRATPAALIREAEAVKWPDGATEMRFGSDTVAVDMNRGLIGVNDWGEGRS